MHILSRNAFPRVVPVLILVLLVVGPLEAASQATGEMGSLEKTIWMAVKSFGPSIGSMIGGTYGTVAGPTVVTAIVTALGLSTAGTGFAAAVVIPAAPVIGEIAGSALGAGAVSMVINTGYGLRLRKFQNPPPSIWTVISGAMTQAATDGLIAGGTSYFSAGKAVGAVGKTAAGTLKEQLLKVGKQGAVNLTGNILTGAFSNRAVRNLSLSDLSENGGSGGETSLAPSAPSSHEEPAGELPNPTAPDGQEKDQEEEEAGPEFGRARRDNAVSATLPQDSRQIRSGGTTEPNEPSREVTRQIDEAAYTGVLIGGLTQISRHIVVDQAQGTLVSFVVALNLWHGMTGKVPGGAGR